MTDVLPTQSNSFTQGVLKTNTALIHSRLNTVGYKSMRKMFEEKKLTPEAIQAIMSEQKPNQRERIVLSGDKVRQYIPKNIPLSQTEDYVCKALEHYASYLRKRAERDAR